LKEGEDFVPGEGGKLLIAKVHGPSRKLLLGERPALNMLARASGIATRARQLRHIKEKQNWKGVIAATRKTTPGFRIVEKYASLVGGVDQHRMDLSSMIMLKDNHIWARGSITKAVKEARSVGGFALKIEVECGNQQEAEEAIEAGADVVMLDNFDGAGIHVCAQTLKQKYQGRYSFLIEGSGGLTPENVTGYMSPHVDILSFGSITQSVPHIDFSLKISH
jgi:nicotinate-nucleotide pyrophosphorylase (carboxylating)